MGGRGESVIDYGIRDNRSREKIKRLVVGERVDSDHYPVIMNIEQREEKGKMGTEKRKKNRKRNCRRKGKKNEGNVERKGEGKI